MIESKMTESCKPVFVLRMTFEVKLQSEIRACVTIVCIAIWMLSHTVKTLKIFAMLKVMDVLNKNTCGPR